MEGWAKSAVLLSSPWTLETDAGKRAKDMIPSRLMLEAFEAESLDALHPRLQFG